MNKWPVKLGKAFSKRHGPLQPPQCRQPRGELVPPQCLCWIKQKKKYTALTKIKVCAIINLSLLRCLNCNEKCVQQGKTYHDIMSRIFYVSNRGNDISSMTEFQRINRIMLRSQVHTHFLKVNYYSSMKCFLFTGHKRQRSCGILQPELSRSTSGHFHNRAELLGHLGVFLTRTQMEKKPNWELMCVCAKSCYWRISHQSVSKDLKKNKKLKQTLLNHLS